MTNKTQCSLRLSLFLLVGAALYLGGCGPMDINDPSYLAQMGDMDTADTADSDDDNADTNTMATATEEMQTKVIKLPPAYVRQPTGYVRQPTVVTNTGENVQLERDIFYEKKLIKHQPNLNIHSIHKNIQNNRKYHTTIVNSSSYANSVRALPATVSETTEVLPTTVINAPVVKSCGSTCYGRVYSSPYYSRFLGNNYGVRPGCSRYYSGGFYRYCGEARPTGSAAYHNRPAVAGPYFR